MIRKNGLVASMLLLAGCLSPVKTVPVTTRNSVHPMKAQPLGCSYRLKEVRDERANGDFAGGLERIKLVMPDAARLVRQQLLQGGLKSADSPDARDVVVTLRRMYVAPSLVTKIAVVVYEVGIDGEAPYVLRAQRARANWAGTQDEALAVFADAMKDANEQTFQSLNQHCPTFAR